MKNLLIIDRKREQKTNNIYKALSNQNNCKIHFLINEILINDDLFLRKFDLAILNFIQEEIIDILIEKNVPTIVMVGNKEKHLINLARKAQCIIKGESLDELLMAMEAVEKGGCYISNDLKNLFFGKLELSKTSMYTGNFKDHRTLLTEMELKVVEELINDKTNQQIADTLYLSKRTVEYYIASSIEKLQVKSRVGLAVKITKANLM